MLDDYCFTSRPRGTFLSGIICELCSRYRMPAQINEGISTFRGIAAAIDLYRQIYRAGRIASKNCLSRSVTQKRTFNVFSVNWCGIRLLSSDWVIKGIFKPNNFRFSTSDDAEIREWINRNLLIKCVELLPATIIKLIASIS
jgi:hypothetical protein